MTELPSDMENPNQIQDLNVDGNQPSFAIFSEIEDYNNAFNYEDFERVTGQSYQDYLRANDDMI